MSCTDTGLDVKICSITDMRNLKLPVNACRLSDTGLLVMWSRDSVQS